MTVTVRHLKVSAIPDDSAAADAGEVLPSDWNAGHVVEIDALDGVPIGAVTPAAGTFTTLIGGKDQVNYGQLTGGATTKAVEFKSLGSDTNVALAIRTQGTGAIDLAAGSSGVNISNGGTVTAITRTSGGSGYTSIPTGALSAPTTAGGVQATFTFSMQLAGIAIASGGTGYTVGDVLTVSGGTFGTAAQITVLTVSTGIITSATISTAGQYSVLTPSNTVSVTGGTGTGASFNVTWSVWNGGSSSFTITNAGSGYVEQPTVTFSGGGGSGAAAYATVGGQTIVRALGAQVSFYTPNGEGFRVQDGGSTSTSYWTAYGTSSTPSLRAVSAVSGSIETASAVPIQFKTSTSLEQFRVSHTASAVNYVQVTGAATGGVPVISAQGSDANVPLNLQAKGSGYINAIGWMRVGTASANYIQLQAAGAGSSPVYTVSGTDTNIDLALTPKGTGNVRFGTYTANMALVIQGYIEIKDSGGTVRKLAVIA